MPKRIFGIKTGIYARCKLKRSQKELASDALFQLSHRAMNINALRDGLIRWAERVLRRYGVIILRKRPPLNASRAGYLSVGSGKHYLWVPIQRPKWVKVRNASKTAPAELLNAWWENSIERAKELLKYTWLIRDEIAKGNSETAARYGYELGICRERLEISFIEPRAESGLRVRNGAKKGGIVGRERLALLKVRNAQLIAAAGHLRKRNLSYRAIAGVLSRKPINRPDSRNCCQPLSTEAIRKIICRG
jgi:hypothetical protein